MNFLKTTDRRKQIVPFMCVSGMLAVLLSPVAHGDIQKSNVDRMYVKKGTWAETMVASRAACARLLERPDVAATPWLATKPMRAKSFSKTHFPVDIDVSAAKKGKSSRWSLKKKWVDGKVHKLSGKDSSSTYLFRTLTVDRPVTIPASLGSDDGIELWLNGDKLLSKNLRRGVAPNQDKVALDLKPGDNRLLLKIFNHTGGHGFYFSIAPDAARDLWRRIEMDFPVQTAWIKEDERENRILKWFRRPGTVDMEKNIIAGSIEDIGLAGNSIRDELEALQQDGASPDDTRWLALYERSAGLRAQFRAARSQLEPDTMRTLRLAIEDLVRSFPRKYDTKTDYLQRVTEIEYRLPAILKGLGEGDESVLEDANRAIALRREALLANPLLDFDRLLLVKRGSDRLGLPQNWQGNCAEPTTGYDNEIAVLSPVSPSGKLTTFYRPDGSGFVGDVELNFDADKILFSMPGSHGRWHIWEIRSDGTDLRQLTETDVSDVDNYDPCYLPDGRIIFASTRCFAGVPCVTGKNNVANLCIMDDDGSNIRQLCFDQDHNWCPAVLNNGRVLYTRWEYSDTPHYFSRLLFHMNPDGTNQAEYYGSNSFWPNSTFYARPIPNHPTQVVGIVSGHHGVPRMGELVIFDPAKGRHEADGVVQRIPGYGKKVEPVIADKLVNDSWPKFLHPYPLNDKYFLVSSKPTPDSEWGIYLVDVFDNMLLLKEEPGYVLFEPVPLRKTKRPPVIPDKVDLDKQDATVYMVDVYDGPGLDDVPRGTVKSLRLYEFHYGYPKMGGHKRIAVEGGWDVHRILGTVPVHEDGSAMFTVPANTPLAVQPLDKEGRAIQIMRSWFTAMPGENLSCIGCHDQQNAVPPAKPTMASRSARSDIDPWYGPTRGFSFNREVQPVLDRYCVGCHNEKTEMLDFSAKEKNGWNNFPPAYLALHPYVRRPGPESNYHLEVPLEYHANTSELVQMLEKGHHNVQLDGEAWDRLVTWIDLNVPAHGTWSEHRDIESNFHERRLEMRTRYANRPEDPEKIFNHYTGPASFIEPKPRGHARLASATDINVGVTGWPFDGETAKVRQTSAGFETRRTIDMGNGVSMDLVLIPAGEFVMGSLDGYPDERPTAPVTIEEPFWMGVMEVTNAQFRQIEPDHDNAFFNQQHKDHTTPGYSAQGAGQPAIRVSWSQSVDFCRKLSDRIGETVELPTEAQWEWACRAGTNTQLYFGNVDTDFSSHANLADESVKLLAVSGVNPKPKKNPNEYEAFIPMDARFNDGEKLMADAGKYAPNPWGLHDMHGNVWEWTRSLFKPYPYNEDNGRNDIERSGDRVVRGGSWYDRPKRARSAFRLSYRPYQRVHNVGFRIVIPSNTTSRLAYAGTAK